MQIKYFLGIAIWLLFVTVMVGCKIMERDISSLPIRISNEYKVMNTSRESISSPIPDQKPTKQIFMELMKDKKKAYLFYWDGVPYRDLGIMIDKESWTISFLGEEAKITRTTVFMGQKQEVLVLHYKTSENERLMIYSKDMNKNEFYELLNKIHQKRN